MASEESTSDNQPGAGAGDQPENAEAMAQESDTPPADPSEPGADVAPEKSAAEQLANEALDAARTAVADLDEDAATNQGSQGAPPDANPASNQPPTGLNGTDSLNGSAMGPGADSQPMPFTPEQLQRLASVEGGESIDILADVNLNVKIELGKTRMLVEDVLKLTDGAVVELDKLAGDPVDIYVNERHVARGEVLILNDNFCVRVSEVLESTIEEQ